MHENDQEILNHLRPIKTLLSDPMVTNIFIDRWDNINYTKIGEPIKAFNKTFGSENSLFMAAREISMATNKPLDKNNQWLRTSLQNGDRIHIVLPPTARFGTCITIRKFPKKKYTAKELIKFGMIDQNGIDILKYLVESKKSILVVGPMDSGKTTILNLLTSFIPKNAGRIITIEDTAELKIDHKYWISLITEEQNYKDDKDISYEDVAKEILRMNAKYIIYGEVAKEETVTMLETFSTEAAGFATLHGVGVKKGLNSLALRIAKYSSGANIEAIKMMVNEFINIVVFVKTIGDDTKKVLEIAEVVGGDEIFKINTLYKYKKIDEETNKGRFTIMDKPKFLSNSDEFDKVGDVPEFWEFENWAVKEDI